MPPNLPPHEPPEPEQEILPEPRMPRFIVRLGWIALAIGLFITMATDFGRPETLPDGTLQATWTGLAVLLMIFGGFAIVFFSATPWTLFQFIFVVAGGYLGIDYFSKADPKNPIFGDVGALIGLTLGAGVAYLATLLLSWLVDVVRRLVARRRPVSRWQRISDGPDETDGEQETRARRLSSED